MLRRNWSLESAGAALNPENAKKWGAEKHSCDAGTQILHKKDALESTSVGWNPTGASESIKAALERRC